MGIDSIMSAINNIDTDYYSNKPSISDYIKRKQSWEISHMRNKTSGSRRFCATCNSCSCGNPDIIGSKSRKKSRSYRRINKFDCQTAVVTDPTHIDDIDVSSDYDSFDDKLV